MSNGNGVPTKGKAVVTGASSGIGRVYADRLAGRGYNLILVARRSELLAEVANEIRNRHGVAVETMIADLTKLDDLERVAKQVESDEKIDVLVNNAGLSLAGPVSEADPERMLSLIELNSIAPLRLLMAVLPRLKRQNSGTIINIGSVVGVHAYQGNVVYSATKAFLHSLTAGLARELEGTNVRLQLVAPAATASEIWEKAGLDLAALPEGSVMTAENCVDAALNGLDQGELLTFPSVEDQSSVDTYEERGFAILGAAQMGKPASRYNLA